MKDELEYKIKLKEQELANYKESSKNFPYELHRRFAVHYKKMLQEQLDKLYEEKRLRDGPW